MSTSQVFEPRTATREDRRQATESLGKSFCKTVTEPITNSDSSGKRNLKIPQSSGVIELMLETAKGTLLDTAALKKQVVGRFPKRRIIVEVVGAKTNGRPTGEIVIIDQAEGMTAAALRSALEEISRDNIALAGGVEGRSVFGRG